MQKDLRLQLQRREELLGQVRRILIDKLHVPREPDEIDPDTPLFGSGLGLDSIDAVELMVCMSADYGVLLPNDTIGRAEMRTVNSLVDLVLAKEEVSSGGA